MRVVVPFGARDPATRLAPLLSRTEREAFAERMLADVLEAVRAAGGDPELLVDTPEAEPVAAEAAVGAPVTMDKRPLTAAVNAVITTAAGPIAIVMSDLALATPRAIARLLKADGDVVIAPGRGGGTNALVVDHPEFRVDYHGASYLDHLRAARAVGATVRELDSMRLATDIDEPGDLAELLLHGDGAAADWLREAGFELDVDDGRVGVVRDV